MPEGPTVPVADTSSQAEARERSKRRWEEVVEVIEVAFLAIVAIATAWSGYQASKWDARQALLYGQASRNRFEADAASTLGGQLLVADASMFNGWLQAHASGDRGLQDVYVRRFSPDYRAAFHAWLKTRPFTNAKAPPGPGYMPGFRNPQMVQAARLNAQASKLFDAGTAARETAEKFVRATVLFAAVLFLVAVAQRFKIRNVRIGANVLALGLLVFAVLSVITLPRL